MASMNVPALDKASLAAYHLADLWEGVPGDYFCASTRTQSGKWRDHYFTREQFGDLPAFLDRHKDRDIYACPLGFRGPARKKELAVLPNRLWADMDEASPHDAILRPTIALESSAGRFVAFWKINGIVTEDLNRRLTYAIGADKSGWDLTQVLRVAHTTNYKRARPEPVRMLWNDGRVYSVAEVEQRLTSLDTPKKRRLPRQLAQLIRDGAPEGQRSEVVMRVVAGLKFAGWMVEDIVEELEGSPLAARYPEEGRLREDIERCYQKAGAQKGTMRPFELIAFDDLLVSTSRAYLIKGLMPRTGLVVVWGPPKCGKSFWTFDAMMHVALGWDYRGRRVQSGPVVYCAFEGADGFKGRAEAFRREHLREVTVPIPFYLQPMRMDLVRDQPSLSKAIRSKLGTRAPPAVVLDTLNRSLSGSESSDEDMSAYVNAADAIRESFGCAVIIVHHCGVKDKRPRGHTSLTGAADAQIAIKRDHDGNSVAEVEFTKDGPEGDVIASLLRQVELGMDDDGDPITSCVIAPADNYAPAARNKLSKAAGLVLAALGEAVADEDGPVTEEAWRKAAYKQPIAKGGERAKQKAFRISVDALMKQGSVRSEGELYDVVD